MKRFKNILFVAENHKNGIEAFERAVSLAKRNEAKLTVVGAVKVSTLDALIDHKTVSLGALQQRLVKERTAQLEETVAALGDDSLDVTIKVILGSSFVEIVQEVLRNDHDLVVKAAENLAGINTTWFGSNDMHMMRKCPCPVWIVKPTRGHRYERILAAVDTTPGDSRQDGLNRMIMDLSTSLARQEDSELHVVHTWNLQGDDWMAARAALSKSEVATITEDVHDQHQTAFESLLADYEAQDLRMRTHLIEGRAGMVIPAQARRQDVDLIVMGTVARTGIPGFIIGNTAENVLNQVNCSVMTVKPLDFVTPLRLAS